MANLSDKAWAVYLRNEQKYDKWGAQGKILLMQELAGTIQQDFHKTINKIFPRTFYCERNRPIDKRVARAIIRYYNNQLSNLAEYGLSGKVLRSTALEETAEKFCISVERAGEILNPPI